MYNLNLGSYELINISVYFGSLCLGALYSLWNERVGEGEREGGREGGRERGREGEREGRREGRRE